MNTDNSMGMDSILLVEDEALIREYLKFIIKGWGYRIAGEASSGKNAIEAAESLSPDLILMDVSLEGGMNGLEAAEQIDSRLGIPVLLMSAYSSLDGADGIIRERWKEYVRKPIDEDELERKIRNVLAVRHACRQEEPEKKQNEAEKEQ